MPLRFGPLRTENPLGVLARGIAGIGYGIEDNARLRREQEAEEARYQTERADSLDWRDQQQANADRSFEYGVSRDQVGDTRYEDEIARELANQRFGRIGAGFQDPTDPTSYDPTQSTDYRLGQATGDADLGRSKELASYQNDLAMQRAQAAAALQDQEPPDLTEGERDDVMFIKRIEESLPQVLEVIEQGGGEPPITSGTKRIPIIGGGFITNQFLTSDKAQTFNAQISNIVGALLRKETGAAIAKEEWDYANDVWVPLVSDDPDTVEQKMRNIQTALEGMKAGLPLESYAPGYAQTFGGAPQSPATGDGSQDPNYQAYLQRFKPSGM